MRLLHPCFKLALCMSLAQGVSAQNDFFNTINIEPDGSSDKSASSEHSIIGWITQKISQGLENPPSYFSRNESGLNKVETSVFAQLDTSVNENTRLRIGIKAYHDEIYRIDDDNFYSEDETNEFRNRVEIKDFYIEHQNENGLYVKAGNQILAWGMSEFLRVTDLINTEDQYTFAQQDLEDIRLQVPAILLSYTVKDWALDWVLSYQAGTNDLAPQGDEFDPFISQRNSGLKLLRDEPANEMEGFFRASTHHWRGDFQFVAGEFNDNALSVSELETVGAANPAVHYQQQRMRAIGLSTNWVEGSWLLFAELGLHLDKAVRPNSDSFFRQLNGWDEKDQTLGVLGVEYNGFRDLLLSFEVDTIHTNDHDQFIYADEDQLSFGARAYWNALNERLQFLAVWNELANDDGSVARLSVNYNYSDQLDLGLTWVGYSSNRNSAFYPYSNNDVFQLQAKYNFQL